MKKILIVVPNDSLGGAEQYLRMVSIHFKDEAINIVHFNKFEGTNWFDGKKTVPQRFMSYKSERIGLIKFIMATISKRQSYDYIFSSHIFVNSLVGFLLNTRLLKTKRFVARESTSIFLRYKGLKLLLYKLAYKIGYKKIDLLICQTDLMKEQLIKHFPRIDKTTSLQVIPNPIDLEQIILKADEKSDVDLPEEFIISAGRLIVEKGYDILINVFSKIKKEQPNLKLIILGKGHLLETFMTQIKELGLEEDVIMAGHVNNVYGYFKNAKLCVVSSRIEGFPNVLLQMMSQNNNVVSTKCAGGIENIPGVVSAETNDETSLYNAISNALDKVDNLDNRTVFDTFLKGRDIKSFINKVMSV